jgi:hypothetical protein
MAESTKADPYEVLATVGDGEDKRWSLPQAAMFVTLTSAGLWALIIAGARWLIV